MSSLQTECHCLKLFSFRLQPAYAFAPNCSQMFSSIGLFRCDFLDSIQQDSSNRLNALITCRARLTMDQMGNGKARLGPTVGSQKRTAVYCRERMRTCRSVWSDRILHRLHVRHTDHDLQGKHRRVLGRKGLPGLLDNYTDCEGRGYCRHEAVEAVGLGRSPNPVELPSFERETAELKASLWS